MVCYRLDGDTGLPLYWRCALDCAATPMLSTRPRRDQKQLAALTIVACPFSALRCLARRVNRKVRGESSFTTEADVCAMKPGSYSVTLVGDKSWGLGNNTLASHATTVEVQSHTTTVRPVLLLGLLARVSIGMQPHATHASRLFTGCIRCRAPAKQRRSCRTGGYC